MQIVEQALPPADDMHHVIGDLDIFNSDAWTRTNVH